MTVATFRSRCTSPGSTGAAHTGQNRAAAGSTAPHWEQASIAPERRRGSVRAPPSVGRPAGQSRLEALKRRTREELGYSSISAPYLAAASRICSASSASGTFVSSESAGSLVSRMNPSKPAGENSISIRADGVTTA